MLHIMVRRSRDVSYLSGDPALELDGVRRGAAAWWPKGPARDPAEVLATTDRASVVGYDLVFAAPRALSLLLALDPDEGRGVVEAHRASVAAALDYLESRAVVTRDRRGGDLLVEPGEWPAAVGFTHGVNRHGEPHLHDHVLVGARPSGAERVLDSRSLFAHAPSADALYRASLRAGVA
ncbi:MAG TPA: relaxase domain-containing protein, partial [Acidimicrobiales bacterium]|nr:relaxase domain-containing protein [Acidimicrobiales bacterium]